MLALIFFLLGAEAPARIVAAQGHWAALERGSGCEAMAASLSPSRKDRPQARVSVAFDATSGGRDGEVAVLLSRRRRTESAVMMTVGDAPFLLTAKGEVAWSTGPAQQAAIIAAMRGAPSMKVESRALNGARIIDRYLLDGAPTAIDAAAACAARLANR